MNKSEKNSVCPPQGFDQLAGGIAHDFNNCMASILANVETIKAYLKAKPHPVSELNQCLKDIDLAAQFSMQLADQLKDYSNHCPIQDQAIRPAAFLSNMRDQLERAAGESNTIHLDLQPLEGTLVGNSLQFEQAILNLVQNAGEAMDSGGTIRVRCYQYHPNDFTHPVSDPEIDCCTPYCLIEISDQGCGISQSALKSIFKEHYSTKRSRSTSGLGLATVRRIIRGMGGIIRVCSKINVGSTFQIVLPLSGESIQACTH